MGTVVLLPNEHRFCDISVHDKVKEAAVKLMRPFISDMAPSLVHNIELYVQATENKAEKGVIFLAFADSKPFGERLKGVERK